MHLLFDLDGTLTDPRPGIVGCIRHAFGTLGVEPPPEVELVRLIGPPLQRSFERLLGNGERADQALRAYRERFATVGIFENAVYPGMREALTALRGLGLSLVVATSKPTLFAERILEHFELAHYFAGVYGSELSGGRSDKGELLAHLLRDLALSPRDSLMIGDRSYDIVAGRQNSIGTIGVLWGYGSRDELTEAGADVLVATPEELVLHLRTRNQPRSDS